MMLYSLLKDDKQLLATHSKRPAVSTFMLLVIKQSWC